MTHKQYTLRIVFEACPLVDAQVLEEIRRLRLHILGDANNKGCFSHVGEVKMYVEQQPVKAE